MITDQDIRDAEDDVREWEKRLETYHARLRKEEHAIVRDMKKWQAQLDTLRKILSGRLTLRDYDDEEARHIWEELQWSRQQLDGLRLDQALDAAFVAKYGGA